MKTVDNVRVDDVRLVGKRESCGEDAAIDDLSDFYFYRIGRRRCIANVILRRERKYEMVD